MINEDISNRTVSIQIRAGKKILIELLKAMKALMAKSKQAGGLEEYIKQEGNEIKLKDMVKKGQLEEIDVKEPELKELRKELNKHGVKFSVLRIKKQAITMSSFRLRISR